MGHFLLIVFIYNIYIYIASFKDCKPDSCNGMSYEWTCHEHDILSSPCEYKDNTIFTPVSTYMLEIGGNKFGAKSVTFGLEVRADTRSSKYESIVTFNDAKCNPRIERHFLHTSEGHRKLMGTYNRGETLYFRGDIGCGENSSTTYEPNWELDGKNISLVWPIIRIRPSDVSNTKNITHNLSLWGELEGASTPKTTLQFILNEGPEGGDIIVNPREGKSFETFFTISTTLSSWISSVPLSFRLLYEEQIEGESTPESRIYLSSASQSTKIRSQLLCTSPLCRGRVILQAIEPLGGVSERVLSVPLSYTKIATSQGVRMLGEEGEVEGENEGETEGVLTELIRGGVGSLLQGFDMKSPVEGAVGTLIAARYYVQHPTPQNEQEVFLQLGGIVDQGFLLTEIHVNLIHIAHVLGGAATHLSSPNRNYLLQMVANITQRSLLLHHLDSQVLILAAASIDKLFSEGNIFTSLEFREISDCFLGIGQSLAYYLFAGLEESKSELDMQLCQLLVLKATLDTDLSEYKLILQLSENAEEQSLKSIIQVSTEYEEYLITHLSWKEPTHNFLSPENTLKSNVQSISIFGLLSNGSSVGLDIKLESSKTPMQFLFTFDVNALSVYERAHLRCKFWDKDNSRFSSNGMNMKGLELEKGEAYCLTWHLSDFVISIPTVGDEDYEDSIGQGVLNVPEDSLGGDSSGDSMARSGLLWFSIIFSIMSLLLSCWGHWKDEKDMYLERITMRSASYLHTNFVFHPPRRPQEVEEEEGIVGAGADMVGNEEQKDSKEHNTHKEEEDVENPTPAPKEGEEGKGKKRRKHRKGEGKKRRKHKKKTKDPATLPIAALPSSTSETTATSCQIVTRILKVLYIYIYINIYSIRTC